MGDFDFKTTHFTVKGFAELYRNLDGLTVWQKKVALEPMLVNALTPMSIIASSLAPDDPLTGPPWDLKSSISVGTRQRTGRSKSDRALGQYAARAYMGPTKFGYPQAIFAEFGTGPRQHKTTGKSVGAMTARPYMRPAWDSGKTGALEIIKAQYAGAVMAAARTFAVKAA